MTMIPHVQLPGTPLKFSRLVFGSVPLKEEDLDGSFALLDAFAAAGGNAIDTAHIYGSGAQARVLAQWMKSRGNREQMVILDKGCHPMTGGPRVNAPTIRQDVEDELRRLETDYLDAWSFHRDQPGVDVRPLVDELHRLKEEGKIRCYGASNWTLPRQESFNRQAAWRGAAPLAFNNPNYCLAVPNEQMWGDSHTLEPSEEAWHTAHQIPLVSWSAAAAGWFAGVEGPDVMRVFANPENELRRARVREMAKARGASPVQVALAWVLNAPFPTWAIIGGDRPEHFAEAAGACALQLSAADRVWLETGK